MKNIICNIIFLFSALTLITSCAPKANDKVFSNVSNKHYDFKPRNNDRELVSTLSSDFKVQSVIGIDQAQQYQSPWVSNSVEIFKLAENSMELGDLVPSADRLVYKKFGHELLNAFYQSKGNSTQFDKNQSLFLPAALGFEGEKIKTLFAGIGSKENIEGVEKSFVSHKITWPQTQPTLKPAEFVRSIKNYLLDIASVFHKNGVSASFVKTFSAQLEKDYINALVQGELKLKDTDQNQNLKLSSTLILEVIQTLTFIPQEAVKPLLSSIVRAKQYAELIEQKHISGKPQPERLLQVIANIWLDLTAVQREKYIKPANPKLFSELNDTSAALINWFAGRKELSPSDLEYYGYGKFYKYSFLNGLGTSCHADVQVNLTAWLNFNDAQKANFQARNPELFNIFSRYKVTEIKSDILANFSDGEFKKPFTGGAAVKKFHTEIQPLCISKVQLVLDRSINLYLLSELDIQIRNWGSMIEKTVADKTLSNLQSLKVAVESQSEFKAYFNKLATPIMNDLLFNDTTLNGLENAKVQLFINDTHQMSMKRTNYNDFETGAEVLGVSLAAQYRRILELPEFENKAVNSKDYYKILFSQMNKMISMIGFRTIDNNLVSSLHRNFVGNYKDLDVYKYECSPEKVEIQRQKKSNYERAPTPDNYVDLREDCEGYEEYHKNLFEIPDLMTIAGSFTPSGPYQKTSSVRSQAEIIRGAAKMLQYFNDWKGPNDFDLGMGKEKYSDINLFPKSAFVNLTVATMTASIRGLQREVSSLKLFNMMGQEIPDWAKNGIPDPENKKPNEPMDPAKQVIQAAMVDIIGSGTSKTVKTEDLAYYMVAIDEFLIATAGIEKTHASVINPPDKTVKDNLEAILKGRRLLKLMMFAMSNFMINRLQDEDGGFRSSYSLETNQKNAEPRTLEVQMAVIDALLRVYGQWGGKNAAVSAIESYYFMNQKLWSTESSFYKISENSATIGIKPHVYIKAVMNFKKIEPYLNTQNSKAQAQRLFDYYSKEFLKWNQSAKPAAALNNF